LLTQDLILAVSESLSFSKPDNASMIFASFSKADSMQTELT
jgi:hypothetical protein